jgi:hypothetical protein
MKKASSNKVDERRAEYDLRELPKDGLRGKYAEAYRAGASLVQGGIGGKSR